MDVAVDGAGLEVLLLPADGRDLGSGEDVRGDAAPLQRDHGVAQRVEDGGASLHRGDGCQGHEGRAVSRRVDVGHRGAGNPVDPDVPRVGELHARLGEPDARRVGDRSDRHEAMTALDGASVREGHDDAVAGPLDALRAGARHHRHPAAREDLLEHGRGIPVLAGEHLVTAGDQGDLRAEVHVGGGKLGAGDAGSHDDEVLGQRRHVVELGPGEDALPVGHGARQLAGRRPDRDDESVGLDAVEVGPAGAGGHDDRVVIVEAAVPRDDAHAGIDELGAHVIGLLTRQGHQPLVDRGEIDRDLGLERTPRLPVREQLDAEIRRLRDRDGGIRRRDEALRGHDVGDDRRAAHPRTLDESHLRPELRGGQCRLVSPGAAAEDGDRLGVHEARRHCSIVSAGPLCPNTGRVS